MKELSNIKKGAIGEKYTAKYLKRHKFRILAHNLRNRYSEIDIIAESKEYIVFVEVKTRRENQPLRPSAAVNFAKQQKIMKAAKHYLSYTYTTLKQPRFDVAEVYLNDKNKVVRINYIENAFWQGGNYAVL
ncbi:MAG: YraN family protein [Ruminococcus sp.]|nr:YraN family protein [Ruminococcus sp.]